MTKYTLLFKQQVMDFYLQNDKYVALICRHLNLSKATI